MTVTEGLLSGSVLAGYRVESILGRGGMSAVYLAEDSRLQRKVALKVMSPQLAEDQAFRRRFLAESQLAASIDHPNIVPIYGAGEDCGQLYIAMRYVPGGDLRAKLRRAPLDPDEAIGIVAQIASALDAAHARGLVHRDVKPSNVLLDSGTGLDGVDHAYLADFGLTKRNRDRSSATEAARLVGTIDYMAPEQIAGGTVDARVDVYALGCVLYECLTGSPPFPRVTDVEVVFAHLEQDPPSAAAERPELPADLDTVIARAMAKDPDGRYPSCGELVRAASAVLVDEATRLLTDVASRAATGRDELTGTEAELVERVLALQAALSRGRALSSRSAAPDLVVPEVCPFKGLASYGVGDTEYFFGRERLVAELATRLIRGRFVAIVGASGSGKSSLLQAGLLPAVTGGALPGSGSWRQVLLRPGDRPSAQLGDALGIAPGGAPELVLGALGGNERLLLAVDQLEEVFTACESEEERAGFLQSLAQLAADPHGRVIVVAAVRADYYGRFADYPEVAGLLAADHVLVGPMQASQVRRAVELPAARAGLQVEPELVDALIDDVEGEPGALPLLSTALVELWVHRSGPALTLAGYHSAGGVGGAVARLAESTYLGIPPNQRPLVRTTMLRLVGEGDDPASPVRRRASLAEFDLQGNPDAQSVLSALAASRLVTVSEGSVEVAHEALLREWPRLADWIEEDAQARHLRGRITESAASWDAAGRDPGELYRGARLAAVLDLPADGRTELNALERDFVDQSRAAAVKESGRARRTNRRLRGLLVAAVLVGLFAFVQRDQAQESETVQLAHSLGAQALVEEDLDLSMLLARQAVALHDTPQTRGYLWDGLLRHPAALGTIPTNSELGALQAVAVSPDGRTLALADYEKGLFFFDAQTLEPIGEPMNVTFIQALAFHPDGRTLAFAGEARVGLIDTASHRRLEETTMGWRSISRLLYAPDGSKLVVIASVVDDWGGQTYLSIRNAETLAQIGGPLAPPGFSGRWISEARVDAGSAILGDSRTLLTASATGELTWWDIETRRAFRTQAIDEGYHAMAVRPDGTAIAIGLDDGVQLIDAATSQTREVHGMRGTNPTHLLFSPDGSTLVATGADGLVTLWSTDTLTQTAVLSGHSRSVGAPAFSTDGRTLYTVSSDGKAIAWDVSGERGIETRFAFTSESWLNDRSPGIFSPDGTLIAVGLAGEGIALWDADELTPSGEPLTPTGGSVGHLAFSRDGRLLAALAGSQVTIWDVESRSPVGDPVTVGREVNGIGFSPDATTLLVAGGPGVLLFDVATGADVGGLLEERLWSSTLTGAGALAVSPAEPLVAFVREGLTVEVWNIEQQSLVAKASVPGRTIEGGAIAFSSDGRLIATGGADPNVAIWDAHTGELVRDIRANVGSGVNSLAFSADSTVLAMGGSDGFAALWDVESGSQLGTRLALGSREVMLDFSPDGARLLTTLSNGQGSLWVVDQQSWLDRACAVANRTLTEQEWEEYLPGRPYEPACVE